MGHTGKIELDSWPGFAKVMEAMKAGQWIYRGQEDASWPLESGLDRYLKQFGKAGVRKKDGGSRDDLFCQTFPRAESFAFSRFRTMTRNYEKWESEVDALIAMQHYGAKTRLLDFTTSIMIALFFAYENQVNGKERAIYAINYSSLLEQDGMWSGYKKFLSDRMPWVDEGDEQSRWALESQIENQYFRQFAFEEAQKRIGHLCSEKSKACDAIGNIHDCKHDKGITIIPLYTSCSNKRQMAQSGVELMPCSFDWFDKDLAAALKISIQDINDPRHTISNSALEERDASVLLRKFDLIKIVFKSQMEKNAWQFLDQANINAATIYPDFVGIAKSTRYSNSTIVIDDKLGRPKESEQVSNFWVTRDKIILCRLSDTISSAIDKMMAKGISHAPLLDDEDKVVGVFSESTMMEAWKEGKRLRRAATIRSICELLPIERHSVDTFEFVSKDVTAACLYKIYQMALEDDKRIGLFLVTENGNPNEPLLGIATGTPSKARQN